MKEKELLFGSFQNFGRQLHRYGTIVDKTDIERDGMRLREFVIRSGDDVWNMSMINGTIVKILLVQKN